MNTPKPCDTCKFLYYDCLFEDDSNYDSECTKGLSPKDEKCKGHVHYDE